MNLPFDSSNRTHIYMICRTIWRYHAGRSHISLWFVVSHAVCVASHPLFRFSELGRNGQPHGSSPPQRRCWPRPEGFRPHDEVRFQTRRELNYLLLLSCFNHSVFNVHGSVRWTKFVSHRRGYYCPACPQATYDQVLLLYDTYQWFM